MKIKDDFYLLKKNSIQYMEYYNNRSILFKDVLNVKYIIFINIFKLYIIIYNLGI